MNTRQGFRVKLRVSPVRIACLRPVRVQQAGHVFREGRALQRAEVALIW